MTGSDPQPSNLKDQLGMDSGDRLFSLARAQEKARRAGGRVFGCDCKGKKHVGKSYFVGAEVGALRAIYRATLSDRNYHELIDSDKARFLRFDIDASVKEMEQEYCEGLDVFLPSLVTAECRSLRYICSRGGISEEIRSALRRFCRSFLNGELADMMGRDDISAQILDSSDEKKFSARAHTSAVIQANVAEGDAIACEMSRRLLLTLCDMLQSASKRLSLTARNA